VSNLSVSLTESEGSKAEILKRRALETVSFGVIKRLLRNGKGAVGTVILLLLVAMGIWGARLAPYNPNELNLDNLLASPSPQHWFGTDELGRDILSRVIFGASISLQAGVLAVVLGAIVGVLTGLPAGYLGGWRDAVIMRIWDTILALPSIFLAIGIVTILGPGRINAVIAVAVISMPAFARLVRGVTLSIVEQDFVEAARAIGCSDWRIMLRTIFPNCLTFLVVQMAIAAPTAILVEASLSYLGLGSQPPEASWGNMLSAAQGYLYRAPTYGIFPGLAIVLVVFGVNFFADGLQDALDPRRIHAAAKMK
jgi:peptide/nickel transport system permease protein